MIDALGLTDWVALAGATIFIGIAKTGIRGSTMLAIPIFVSVLGARFSTGVVLILFLLGDGLAVRHYLKETQWRPVRLLFLWSLAGVAAGAVVGELISEEAFQRVIGFILLVSAGLLLAGEVRREPVVIRDGSGVATAIGLVGGFVSMIGNVAAPIINLYLLARGSGKNQFIATSAMFFFFLNLSKVPVHIFYWRTMDPVSATLAAILVVPLLLGGWLGVVVARLLPERPFRIIVVGLAAVSALRLVFF